MIRLQAKTNSKKEKIVSNGEILTIFLKSKPIQNKANIELISLIKKKLNISSNQIQLISGSKSKDKTIKIAFNKSIEEEEIIKKLLE
ncbi:MAG: DUF167 domain-containing protein [Promethearchaeota archaeon]